MFKMQTKRIEALELHNKFFAKREAQSKKNTPRSKVAEIN